MLLLCFGCCINGKQQNVQRAKQQQSSDNICWVMSCNQRQIILILLCKNLWHLRFYALVCVCVCGKCEFYEFTPPSTSAVPVAVIAWAMQQSASIWRQGVACFVASDNRFAFALPRLLAAHSTYRLGWVAKLVGGVQVSVRRCAIINSIVINCNCMPWYVKV